MGRINAAKREEPMSARECFSLSFTFCLYRAFCAEAVSGRKARYVVVVEKGT